MENTKEIYLEDGRKAKQVVTSLSEPSGEEKIVTEVWEEPEVEKKLSKRVVSYKKPLVYKREIEILDPSTGSVVESKVESLEDDSKLEVRQQIKFDPNAVQAMSVNAECNYVTRDELNQTVLLLAKTLSNRGESTCASEQNTVSAQSILEEKYSPVNKDENPNVMKEYTLWGVLAALAAGLVYVAFLM